VTGAQRPVYDAPPRAHFFPARFFLLSFFARFSSFGGEFVPQTAIILVLGWMEYAPLFQLRNEADAVYLSGMAFLTPFVA
jgi:hypothetical protein